MEKGIEAETIVRFKNEKQLSKSRGDTLESRMFGPDGKILEIKYFGAGSVNQIFVWKDQRRLLKILRFKPESLDTLVNTSIEWQGDFPKRITTVTTNYKETVDYSHSSSWENYEEEFRRTYENGSVVCTKKTFERKTGFESVEIKDSLNTTVYSEKTEQISKFLHLRIIENGLSVDSVYLDSSDSRCLRSYRIIDAQQYDLFKECNINEENCIERVEYREGQMYSRFQDNLEKGNKIRRLYNVQGKIELITVFYL